MIYARIRFAAAMFCAVPGTVLAVGAFDFGRETERWLALGAGCVVLVNVAIAFAVRNRGAVQRVLDLLLVLVCVWTIVCSRAIEAAGAGSSPSAVKWFSFAEGAAIAGFGLIALLLHEFGLERDLAARGSAER